MGVIPTISTSPGLVGTAPMPGLASAEVFGGPYAQQAASGRELAAVGNEFANKYIDAKLQVDAANQSADISKQLEQVQFEAAKIPDRQRATEMFDARSAEVMKAYGDSGANPLVKAHVTSRITAEMVHRRAAAQTGAFQLESQTQRGQLDEQLDSIAKEATTIADPRLRDIRLQAGLDAIDGRVAGGWMNPEAGAERKLQFKSDVYSGMIAAAMAKSPEQGVAAFNQYKGNLNAKAQAHFQVVANSAQKGLETDAAATGLIGPGPTSIGTQVKQLQTQFPELEGRITSGDRSKEVNSAVGGAENSQHLQHDKAVDVTLNGLPADKKQQILDAVLANPNVKGFGYYNDHIHIDTREGPRQAWGVPPELKEKVDAFLANKNPAMGDSYASWLTDRTKRIADYVANPANGSDRFNVAARAQSTLSAQNAYVTASRKEITDQFDTGINNLAINKTALPPGFFDKLADRMSATGDQSTAALYRFFGQHEEDMKNFWSLPPAMQLQYAHLMPGQAGHTFRATLVEAGKARTEAMRAGNEQNAILMKIVENKDDPKLGTGNLQEATDQFMRAGRPDLARKAREDYTAYAQAYGLTKQASPAELEAIKQSIDEAVNKGGESSRQALTLQKHVKTMEAANHQEWDTNPLGMYLKANGLTAGVFSDEIMKDPAKLQEFLNARGNMAVAAQNMKFQGSATAPIGQVVGPLSPEEASRFKQAAAGMNLQQLQFTTASIATAMPKNMITPFAKSVGGDEFGDSLATASYFYQRKLPGDRDIADAILAGADLRKKGGPEMKEGITPGNPQFLSTMAQTLGDARRGLASDSIDMLNHAAVALYTKMMQGNANAGAFQSDVMTKAIEKVYGERYSGKNGEVILPSGMTGYDYRQGIFNLTDSDLPPLPTLSGKRLTADDIKRAGQFVTVGDGIYKVQVPDPNGSKMHDLPMPNGAPWTIDIRQLRNRGDQIVAPFIPDTREQQMLGVMPQRTPSMPSLK